MITKAMLEQIYLQADELAKGIEQKVGEDFCITLGQLHMILDKFED